MKFRFVRDAGRFCPKGSTKDLTPGAVRGLAAELGVETHELGLWVDMVGSDGVHYTERRRP